MSCSHARLALIIESKMKHLDIVDRLIIRASIRRNIRTRKSVLNGEPDRISDLLEEAASEINRLRALQDRSIWAIIKDKLF